MKWHLDLVELSCPRDHLRRAVRRAEESLNFIPTLVRGAVDDAPTPKGERTESAGQALL